MTDWNGEERRKNRLHADDVSAIVQGVTESLSSHYCRFSFVEPEDIKAIVPFMLKFKRLSEKVGSIVLVVLVTAITGGILGLIALGFWTKAKPGG